MTLSVFYQYQYVFHNNLLRREIRARWSKELHLLVMNITNVSEKREKENLLLVIGDVVVHHDDDVVRVDAVVHEEVVGMGDIGLNEYFVFRSGDSIEDDHQGLEYCR